MIHKDTNELGLWTQKLLNQLLSNFSNFSWESGKSVIYFVFQSIWGGGSQIFFFHNIYKIILFTMGNIVMYEIKWITWI